MLSNLMDLIVKIDIYVLGKLPPYLPTPYPKTLLD